MGAIIFVAFLATTFLLKARPPVRKSDQELSQPVDDLSPHKLVNVMLMWLSGMLLIFANMSIEPIITLYIGQFLHEQHAITLMSGVVMAAAALGSILSAPYAGRLADRIGHWRVLSGGLLSCALLLIPQAFITDAWQLLPLRFLMGLALGGLMPCITAIIRHTVPATQVGRMLGYSTSAQYIGQVTGPVFGGFIGGAWGMRPVFLATSLVVGVCAWLNWRQGRKGGRLA